MCILLRGKTWELLDLRAHTRFCNAPEATASFVRVGGNIMEQKSSNHKNSFVEDRAAEVYDGIMFMHGRRFIEKLIIFVKNGQWT